MSVAFVVLIATGVAFAAYWRRRHDGPSGTRLPGIALAVLAVVELGVAYLIWTYQPIK